MRMLYSFLISAALMLGCAHVQVEAPKDPIKLDISMRLDVYQHVVKDIDDIENIVSGENASVAKKLSDIVVPPAHADDISPEVREAALRRKNRLAQISALESQGILGEDRQAYLAVRKPGAEAQALADQENADRRVIYQGISRQNGTTEADVQKLYAQRLQANAPAGTPVENAGGQWSVKS